MADAQAPIVDKVDQPSVPGVSSTSDNAPPKDPLADSLGVKPTEEKPAEQAPAAVDPAPSKLEAPAAETAPVQPTDAQSKPAEQILEPVKLTEPAAETKPVEPASGPESKTTSEVTGALQSESKPPAPEPAETVNAPAPPEPAKDEPVKDEPVKESIIPPAAQEKPAEPKPETATTAPVTLNGGSKDVEMKDVPEPAENLNALAPDTTEKPSIPAAAEPVAADKRKAETNGDEPKGKKQKTGAITDAVSSVVESAKETVAKATNGPSRKDSKKGKKEPAPIGKTLRKTRSQGPVET